MAQTLKKIGFTPIRDERQLKATLTITTLDHDRKLRHTTAKLCMQPTPGVLGARVARQVRSGPLQAQHAAASVAKAARTPTPVRGTRMACEAKGAPCCALPLPVPSPPSFAPMRKISAPSEPAREQTRRRQRQFASGHIRPEKSVHMKCINRAPCWARRMAAGCATGPPGGRKAGRCVRGSAGARLTVLEALFLHSS